MKQGGDFDAVDHNLTVGRHPEVTDSVQASGSSGRGRRRGSAAGRGVSQLIIHGGFGTWRRHW